jgi:hypothetical protein
MERNLNQKIANHMSDLKSNITQWLETNQLTVVDSTGKNRMNDLLRNISDYQTLELSKEDFKRRTRIKTIIPTYERCCALRLNGEQCTRKNKTGERFCGTHLKGLPYGQIQEYPKIVQEKIEIQLEEICGIHQYIDPVGNVYSSEDILNSIPNPRVISHWKKVNGEFVIQ